MRLAVDAGSLAVLVASAAGDTLALVYGHAEEGEARDEAQGGADGADVIAPGTAVRPGQVSDTGQGQESDEGDHPPVGMDYARNDAPVRAVRCDESHEDLDAEHKAEHEHDPDPITEGLVLGLVAEGLAQAMLKFGNGLARGLRPGGAARETSHLLLAYGAAYAQDDVLPDAERADDGTIDASADECQQHQRDDDRDVEREAGGQELEFRHPAEPLPADACKQQRDADKEDTGERDSDFLQHRGLYLRLSDIYPGDGRQRIHRHGHNILTNIIINLTFHQI